MPIISFDERTKKDPQVCSSVPEELFSQFCNIALDFLKLGPKQKMFQGAKSCKQPKEMNMQLQVLRGYLWMQPGLH